MKVCVLQPDYGDSTVDYKNYDPPRDLSTWLPDDEVHTLLLRKATVYRQLREASRKGYDIYVNLCEGYLDWDTPSLDVIWSLDLLNLPYTGPNLRLYDPSKVEMKFVAIDNGVTTPDFVEARTPEDVERAARELRFPLFVKPARSGDSLGIDEQSLARDEKALTSKCAQLWEDFDAALIEEFIEGREATVLMASRGNDPIVLQPLEFLFANPTDFKTYALKVTEHHPDSNRSWPHDSIAVRLKEAARKIFLGFRGEGYARLDFRVAADGQVYFLDINFACSIFYAPGHEGSADYVLRDAPGGPSAFLRHIIADGLERHRQRQPKVERRRDGYFALRDLTPGELLEDLEDKILSTGVANVQSTRAGWRTLAAIMQGEALRKAP